MKKIILSLMCLCAISLASAQNFFDFNYNDDVYHDHDTITAELGSGEGLILYMGITNITTSDQTVIAKIEPINANGIAIAGICAGGRCMDGQTTSNAFEVAAGATDDEVYPEFTIGSNYPAGQYGTFKMSINHYRNSNLSSYVVLKIYRTATAGIDNPMVVSHMSAYPNPANGMVTINYALANNAKTGKVVLYDVMGRKVKEAAISSTTGSVTLNTAELATGVYMYGIIANGVASKMEKLMIR